MVCLCFLADIISCVEFNHDGEMFATGDKGGRVVIFQRDLMVSYWLILLCNRVLDTVRILHSKFRAKANEENTTCTVRFKVTSPNSIT
jgi:hypothetical protein